jgi:hypothetical protein
VTAGRRALVKAGFAAIVGVPGTLVFVPIIALALSTFLFGIVGAGADGNFEFGAPARGALLALIWSGAGLAGLMGFWAWVFLRRGAGRRQRLAIAACVAAGMCAVVPFALGGLWLGGLALIGLASGATICVWLVAPRAPLNPDADSA